LPAPGLILLNGKTWYGAAGSVIERLAIFCKGRANYVIGAVIFLILIARQ